MRNPLLKQLLEHMTADLDTAFEETEGDMLKAIQKLRDERADEDEKPIVFSCALSGKLNLDKNKIETALSYSVKTTVKDSHTIEDPDQAELKFIPQ